jgi:TM2 domain-containing membrane protein YozV
VGRENFYILLKLDPSENDETKIKAAIDKQINIWQANLTRGKDRAKWEGYLKLEAEMRRVMLCSPLRRAEAADAVRAKAEKENAAWADEFAKSPLEKGLNGGGHFSIYDFLSKDSDGDDSKIPYGPDDPIISINRRISALAEEYRQKNKPDQQDLIGKCAAFLENEENKRRYDKYIVRKLTDEIEKSVELAQYERVIKGQLYQNIVDKHVKSWFSSKRVKEVAMSYCQKKGYRVVNEQEPQKSTPIPPPVPQPRRADEFYEPPPYQPQPQYPYPEPQQQPRPLFYSDKSRRIAGLLGLFLGPLGLHNFYLGRIKRGIIQLLSSFVIIGIVWGYLEGLLILSGIGYADGDGGDLKGKRSFFAVLIIASVIHVVFCVLVYVGLVDVFTDIFRSFGVFA